MTHRLRLLKLALNALMCSGSANDNRYKIKYGGTLVSIIFNNSSAFDVEFVVR